jgi:hypothetical protein
MLDEDRAERMRAFLWERLADSDNPERVTVWRQDLETWAGHEGLTPDEAITLFESLEGNVWTGTYLDHGHRFRDRWQRVEITGVR